jgi:DNA-binding protein H-NS
MRKSKNENKKRTLEEMKKLQRNVWEERRKSTEKRLIDQDFDD